MIRFIFVVKSLKQFTLENKKALKLIDKIIGDLEEAGILSETIIDDLKSLRPFAVSEKLPVVAKSLRLAFEHIEENEVFVIPIPEDEPLDDDESDDESTEDVEENELVTGAESLIYLLNLIKKSHLEVNIEELREYNRKFEAFAE